MDIGIASIGSSVVPATQGGVQDLAITKEKKNQLLQMYVSLLGDSQAIVFVGSRGLSVAEVTQLRTKIRETGAKYHVVKNTLFRLALSQAGMPAPEFLSGPIAIAFCVEDIAPVVKAIEDFGKDLEEREFEIVGGIIGNDVLDPVGAKALADLPSRDTLFIQIMTGIKAPGTQLTGLLANSIRQVLNLLHASTGRQILSLLQARIAQLEEGDAAA
jgi:large subunit ribosomal protein L10